MSFTAGIQDVQTRIIQNLEELEDKLVTGKMYWTQYNQVLDQTIIHNFMEIQHAEILHHLNEIRHHVQQINYHEQILESIAGNNNVSAQNSHLKSWEKVMEDQNSINNTCFVRRRSKKNKEGAENTARVPKIMVKNRVEHFEELQKCKRTSSTIEPFLECNKVDQTFNSNKCEEKVGSLVDSSSTTKIRKDVLQERQTKTLDPENEETQVCYCSGKKVSNTTFQSAETDTLSDKNGSVEEPDIVASENFRDAKNDIVGVEIWDENYEHKPRIIEMHYKQLSPSPEAESSPSNYEEIDYNLA